MGIRDRYTDAEELKEAIEREISELIPKHITKDDIMASINYNMPVSYTHLDVYKRQVRMGVGMRW